MGSTPVAMLRRGSTLNWHGDPGEAAERLVTLARDGGGPDNIAVIVIDVRGA